MPEPGSNHPLRKTREEIAEAYSSPPVWYDIRGFFILSFAYNSTIFQQLRFFGPNFGPNHLEVACGTGTLLQLLIHWRRWKKLPEGRITGIDYAESMLEGARHRFSENANVSIHHADAAALPFSEALFDTANIANSVHCFPDVDGALAEVFRVLKPGGTLAANVLLYPRTIWPFNWIAGRINKWGISKGILYTPYDKNEIRRKFVSVGFGVIEESVSGNCYNILMSKPAETNA